MDQQSQETSEVLTHAQGGRHSLLTECRPSHDYGAQALSTAPSLGGSRTTIESEVEHLESRARRAEGWLQAIKQEIEDKLLGPIEARRPELPALH